MAGVALVRKLLAASATVKLDSINRRRKNPYGLFDVSCVHFAAAERAVQFTFGCTRLALNP
jgi:hypothetical protein